MMAGMDKRGCEFGMDGLSYYGKPVDEMTRDELIFVLKWYINQQQDLRTQMIADLRRMAEVMRPKPWECSEDE
jgi:hypothetical protein